MQFGRFHNDSKRSAIVFHCCQLGTGMYTLFKTSQIIFVVSAMMHPTVVFPLAKQSESDTNNVKVTQIK